MSTSTTTSCSTPKRRAALSLTLVLLARRRQTASGSARSTAEREVAWADVCGRLIAAAAIVALLCGCGNGVRRARPHRRGRQATRFGSRSSRTGEPVVAEDRARGLRYQLRSTGDPALADEGDLVAAATSYQVATDEAGRTATVTVHRRPRRASASACASIRQTGVQQVYDAFDAAPGRSLPRRRRAGRRRRPARPDPAGQGEQRLLVRARARSSRARPAGALRLRPRENVAALALPGSPGGGGCRFGDEPQCTLPRARRPGRGVCPGCAPRRGHLRRRLRRNARRLRARHRTPAVSPAERARADQVARRLRRPGAGPRGRHAAPRGEGAARLGARRQPVGERASARSRSTRTASPIRPA